MARAAKDGLSKHPTKGFRITIGKKPNGKPRLFWLGHKRPIAEIHANTLRGQLKIMREHGRDAWSDADVEKVRSVVGYMSRSMDEALREHQLKLRSPDADLTALGAEGEMIRETYGVTEGASAAPLTNDEMPADETAAPGLYSGIEAFLESFDGKRKSDRHKQRMRQVLEINLKHVRKDCPLTEINYLWLDRLCDHFKNRPANQKDGKTPLSASSVRGILTYMRLFFVWLDDVEYSGWQMPRKGLKCFKVRVGDLMTPAEVRTAGTIKQFDVPTLRLLYSNASDRDKSIILTALFCGFTQHELSVLEKSEVDLDGAKVTHVRHKTKVQGVYWIPPELVKLMKAEMKARPADALVWRTEEGNPLVSYKDNAQTSDAVRQMWDDLREKAGVPDALPFKYLRKYLADYCTANGGEEMGQVAMSHSRQTVLSRNYSTSRPFARFHELQKQMHTDLTTAKFFEPIKKQP